MTKTCGVHRHREYVPIESHHIFPKGMGGPDTRANRIDICANAHSAVHEYMRLLTHYAGKPPIRERLRFGTRVRRLALDGWTQAQTAHADDDEQPPTQPTQ